MTYFKLGGTFYEQVEGVVMGSPLLPATGNLYMEAFGGKSVNTTPLKPKYFFRYLNDTFISQGCEELVPFLVHLNSINENIKFTNGIEKDEIFPFST